MNAEEIDTFNYENLVVARKAAETELAVNPNDVNNLLKLGAVLLGLSKHADNYESPNLIRGAISKLESALRLDDQCHQAAWWLGTAFTLLGFFTQDHYDSSVFFTKATEKFEYASNKVPGNEVYEKSVQEMNEAVELRKGVYPQ